MKRLRDALAVVKKIGGESCREGERLSFSNGREAWRHTNRPVDYNSTTPVDVKFKGIKFRNPVLVDIRTGVVFEIPRDSYNQKGSFFGIRNLPVYDSPVAVAEKSMIKILAGSPE